MATPQKGMPCEACGSVTPEDDAPPFYTLQMLKEGNAVGGSGDVTATVSNLSGSFSNADLTGSFHMASSTKGDYVGPVASAKRSHTISPDALSCVSSHPSDDELVLVCLDCGMEIGGDGNSPETCPLTGKWHV